MKSKKVKSMGVPFVDLYRMHSEIRPELEKAINQVMEESSFILGKHVEEFEKDFAKYCQAKHAIGVSNGTTALHLALLAAGIGKGDEVITTTNSFFATAEAIANAGARPVFADVDEYYNIDPEKIEEKITKKTKAVMPVHLFGQPAEMQAINEVAEKHSLAVIEDSAQAHGAEYNGKRTGSLADIGCFSFYPAKNLGALGEAGAVTTSNPEFAEKIMLLRAHGEKPKNTHTVIGYNYRMEGLQGAILKVKLKHLDRWNNERRKHSAYYKKLLLENKKIDLPLENKKAKHVFHLFVVKARERQKVIEHLSKNNIATGIHYPTPIHLQQAFSHLGYRKGSMPVAEYNAEHMISLPMFPHMTKEQIEFVAEKLSEVVQ